MTEICATAKDLEDAGVMVPTTLLFALCRRAESWRMRVDNHKLNYAVTPIAAAVPDVTSFLQYTNPSSGTFYANIDLPSGFFFLNTIPQEPPEAIFLPLARPALCLYSFTSRVH